MFYYYLFVVVALLDDFEWAHISGRNRLDMLFEATLLL